MTKKSICVRFKDDKIEGSRCYIAGSTYLLDENGNRNLITETEEEQEQNCYQQLIDDIKRQEFDKTIKTLVFQYLGYEPDSDFKEIRIFVEGRKHRRCELGIISPPCIEDFEDFANNQLK